MLHGRNAFLSKAGERRIMKRIWIFDDHSDELFNVKGKCSQHRVLSHYEDYSYIEKSIDIDEHCRSNAVDCGIKLNKDQYIFLNNIFSGRC